MTVLIFFQIEHINNIKLITYDINYPKQNNNHLTGIHMNKIFFLSITLLISQFSFANSQFDILKAKYENNSNSNLLISKIEGASVGRCYQEIDNTTFGMFLVVKKENSSLQSSKYKMAFTTLGGVSVDSYGRIQSVISTSDFDFQSSASVVDALYTKDLKDFIISNGTGISGQIDSTATWKIRQGNDGLIYGHASQTESSGEFNVYCYFFKKLN